MLFHLQDLSRGGALKLHIINLRNQEFNTDSCSVNDPCKKKIMCVVLDWIAH